MSTFTVCNTADSGTGSLRCEIALANSTPGANTVDFDSTVFSQALTITLTTDQLELSNTCGTETITGPAAGVTISGGGCYRVFQVDADVTASISGLTITCGSTSKAGAGVANYGGTLTLSNCRVSGNSASTNGGGLYTNDHGTTTLENCTVSDNSASTNGGGLYTNDHGMTTLENCTVSGNSASTSGGGLGDYEGTTTLENCTISGNSASLNGGGLYDNYGTTTLDDCTISGNSAGGHGGGLYDFLGMDTLSGVTISSNFAENGGGMAIFFGTTALSNCTFSGNGAFSNGGGLYSNAGSNALSYCTFSGNTASANGGGVFNSYGTTTLANCTVSGNSASVTGGGLYSKWATTALSGCTVGGNAAGANGGGLAGSNGTTTLADCTVSGNVGDNGGGLYNYNSTFTLTDVLVTCNGGDNGGGLSTAYGTTSLSGCTVSGNRAAATGGGAFNDSGTTTLLDCSVSGNSATAGAGVSTYHYGTTTLTNSTVSGNSASTSGGGVDTNDSTSTLTNSTISGNSAVDGGGLYTNDNETSTLFGCTVSLFDCTVSGNAASTSGGGLDNSEGTVTLGNTIVAENTAATTGPDAIGTVTSLGNNLVGQTNGSSGWVGSDLTGTSAHPLNPLLAPLGNYGGPTQTMALLPGSLAINSGNNSLIPAGVTTDQRGLLRVVGGVVDIGAFESSLFTIAVTSGSGQSTGISTAFPAPLVATVTANNPIEPVAGGLVTFAAPQTGATATLTGSPATISANGTVTVGATANGVVGSYTVAAGARGITNTANFNLTNQAIPTLTTAPAMTAVTLGSSPVTLMDMALLSNGYYETGSLTFTLYQGSTLVDTETVSVSGNGSYTTPTGYTLPATGTVTGTYQWDAIYSGDTYNTPASENNASTEQVVVNPANPTITTTPSVTALTLGTSPATLKDTAALAGGYYETGTITFTLYLGSTLVDTETASVSGNGSYTTPTGYTLPTTGTVTGTYQWDASYSGDTNNNSTCENSAAAEQVTVSPASTTINTTPSVPAVTLGTSPVMVKDTAALAGGYYETGTITFTLYLGSTLVDTETVSVSSNGSYSTPSGYTLATIGTVTGNYQWDATYSGDFNNYSTSENGATAEQVTVSKANPSITTTPSVTAVTLGTSPVTLKDTAALAGGYYETGTIRFTLYLGSTLLDTETVPVSGNGSYSTPTGYTLPTTGTVTGSYQWDASYNGDTNNSSTSENNASAERVTVTKANPSITTTPSVTAITLGTSPVTLKDTAALTGGYFETGTIIFTLYQGSTLVDTETVSVSGNGSYSTSTGYALPMTGTVTGTYQWDASYGGDTNNDSASENSAAAEQVTVSPASPTISTTPSVTAVTLGTSPMTLKDTAALTGGYFETGAITFTLYLGSTLLDTETASVSGNGSYTTPTGYTSPTTGTVTGTYQWDASYSGDTNNNSTTENSAAAEQVTVSPANPSITTTPSLTAVTLGTSSVTLKDTAALTGGYYESGTITFTLYLGSTLVDAETASVSGNGSYTTPIGYTLSTTGTVTGTYQWDASYSGDSNNTSTSENNASAEQVTVSKANPSITTTPSLTAVTLGTSPVMLKDTAALTGGYYESGTITFTLYLGSTLVDTETASVSGNGSYTTPIGYTLPTTGTVTGTYQWDASYSGDSNNTSTSENGAASEQVVVTPANSAIATTPSIAAVMLGTSPVTFKDTAAIAGGYYETGTITFTLYLGSTLLDTEAVSVSGNGSYSTPTGYTLPTTGTVTGTYQWDASYNGDTNNSSTSENGATAEQVTVSKANPSITTTPSVTAVTLGTSPVTLKDTAALAGGYYETGTIRFTLYLGSTLLDTETVPVSGNGSYSTPTGYTLPTTGTVTGSYQWDASYNGDTNNSSTSENGATAEQVTVSKANPSITTTPSVTAVTLGTSPVMLKDTAALTGGYYESGTITFTLYLGSTLVDAETASVSGNGSYTTPIGYTLSTTGTVTGTYQWDASYSGDSNNTSTSENNASAEQVTVSRANPSITTTPSLTAVTLGTSSVTLKDTAALTSGYFETGTIIFTLYQGSTLVDTETVSVSGNGSYSTPTGYTLPTTGTVTGTYQWDASYSGDSNNNSTSENNAAAEQVTVSKCTTGAISTVPGGTVMAGGGVALTDSATLSGDYHPTGTVTFSLYAPNSTTAVYTDVVNGNGTYTTSTGTNPGGYLPPANAPTGTYNWVASYSGDGNNNLVSGADEAEIVTGPPNVVVTKTADQATILAGQTAGFVVTITNIGTWTAMALTLNDPLPAGGGGDINWKIDTSQGNPADFSISGAVGSQSLGLSSSFISGGDSLAPGQSISVHITSPTNAGDGTAGTPAEGFDSAGTVAASKISLGTANNYGVLGLTNTAITNSAVTVYGNEGVSQGGTLANNAPSTITGNVYEYATGQYSGPGKVGGSVVVNPTLLAQNDTDALNASATAKALTATQTFGTIITTTTVTGNGGLNVIDINGSINLNNASLILSGTASDVFIVNVTGTAAFVGTGGLSLAGGVTANHVLYNFTGSSGTITSKVGNVFYGTLLGPKYSFNLDGSFIGEIIGGGSSIQLLSNAAVNAGFKLPNTATVSATGDTGQPGEMASATITIQTGDAPSVQANDFATIGFWQNKNGQSLIYQLNGGGSSGTATSLGTWLASNFPHLYGAEVDPANSYEKNLAGATNATVASFYDTLFGASGLYKTYAQIMATALAAYATDPTLAGGTYANNQPFGFNTPPNGTGTDDYNVGSNGSALGLPNNSSQMVLSILAATDQEAASTSTLNANLSAIDTIFNGINSTGDVQNLTLSASGIAYTPSQVLSAYGINNLALDGIGQTIAIVDAYDDPAIFQSLDTFDQQFGLTGSGPTLYQQYGPAYGFLTVLNQSGQSTSLPSTDPSGVGTDNWEVEEALDVEWAHAIAPGAQIVLVEANSQSLSDLMASVATAASQPGVSVVSMSWGFAEGQAVFAADEAHYNSTFNVPGVTFVASAGDYGTSDPEYPAFSPNVVAVGGTTLNLNADNSYNSETGWGYNSQAAGAFIGSGGGISLYEPEPAYQEGVQSTGSRTTPDVSLVADPATGAWIADPYNVGADNPFEVVGGTSLSAPAWAGLVALVNEGRVVAGEAILNNSGPTEIQQALYSLPQHDYNVIASGSNGYDANAGYNLVTGLGTPIANLLVPDLIAYQGPGTIYSGPTVGPLQNATLVNIEAGGSGTNISFSVFNAITESGSEFGFGQAPGLASAIGMPTSGTPVQDAVASHSVVAPVTTLGSALAFAPGSLQQNGPIQTLGAASNFSPVGQISQSLVTVTIAPVAASIGARGAAWSTIQGAVSYSINDINPSGSPVANWERLDGFIPSGPRKFHVSDAILNELASDPVLWPVAQENGIIPISVLSVHTDSRDSLTSDPVPLRDQPLSPGGYGTSLAVLGLAAGVWARGIGLVDERNRRSGRLFFTTRPRMRTSD